ncbi:MAG: YlxR family protein [Deltaproteobacteria bacterium]|nr:YlxR family protein [Deltaproteobacteria bacterium]
MVNDQQYVGGKTEKTGPVRTCLGCGKKAPKASLIRFAVVNGRIVVDEGYSLTGRGAYSCRQEICLRLLAKKGKRLARALRCEKPDPHHDMASLISTTIDSFVAK